MVDEIGYLPVTSGGGKLVNKCHEKDARILTSKRGCGKWGEVFATPSRRPVKTIPKSPLKATSESQCGLPIRLITDNFAATNLGNFSHIREAFAIDLTQRLRRENVAGVLNRLVREREAPECLFADNGAEFTGCMINLWAYLYGVRIDFFRPGKPTDDANLETLNGSFRAECLKIHLFALAPEAGRLIGASRIG